MTTTNAITIDVGSSSLFNTTVGGEGGRGGNGGEEGRGGGFGDGTVGTEKGGGDAAEAHAATVTRSTAIKDGARCIFCLYIYILDYID